MKIGPLGIYRPVHVVIVEERDQLVKSIESKEVAIFVTGQLYREMLLHAYDLKQYKSTKTLAKVVMGIGLFIATVPTIILGAAGYMYSNFKDDFKNYKIKINQDEHRIEFYLNKGKDKYNPKNDVLEFPNKNAE